MFLYFLFFRIDFSLFDVYWGSQRVDRGLGLGGLGFGIQGSGEDTHVH